MYYQNVKATTKVYKPCLSFFISFFLFFTSVTFCSSSKSLFPHFIDPSTLTVCTHDVWNHDRLEWLLNRSHCPYMQRTKPWQTWMASQLYFIVLTVRTRNVQNHSRLEWLHNCILSFSKSVHTTDESMTDFRQCGACTGSPQIYTYMCIIYEP